MGRELGGMFRLTQNAQTAGNLKENIFSHHLVPRILFLQGLSAFVKDVLSNFS